MADTQDKQDERERDAPAIEPDNRGVSSQEPAEGADDVSAPVDGSPRG